MSATISHHNNLRFSALLRRVFPKHAAKLAASAAGRTVRAAEAWLADQATPSWATILEMAAKNDAMRKALIQALQETSQHAPMEDRAVPDAGTCSDEYAGYPLSQLGA